MLLGHLDLDLSRVGERIHLVGDVVRAAGDALGDERVRLEQAVEVACADECVGVSGGGRGELVIVVGQFDTRAEALMLLVEMVG